jgi:mono/diheme cytochrome c family protein
MAISLINKMKIIRMKKTAIITTLVLSAGIMLTSCGHREGRAYMPDMAYSRAYESYAMRDSAKFTIDRNDLGHKIFFNNLPPAGTIKRGEVFPYPVVPTNPYGTPDSVALSLGAQVKNPLTAPTAAELAEAGRLFNINCGVCHGTKAEANGPVAPKIGGVKSIVAAIGNGYTDGKIFYIMTYGQGNMGSYASQLTREQRWRITQYLRSLTGGSTAAAPASDSATVKKDSVAVKK